MNAEQNVGAVQLCGRLRGVSPPVTRRFLVTEQASLSQFHDTLQVAFGWNDEHLYSYVEKIEVARSGMARPAAAAGRATPEVNEEVTD